MNTLKRFIRYYGPYKTVFFLDLICAAIISMVDLAFPQILRTLTKTIFTEEASFYTESPASYWIGTFYHVCGSESVQILCQLSGTYDGRIYGKRYETAAF